MRLRSDGVVGATTSFAGVHLACRAGAICWRIYVGRHWYPDGGTLGYQLPLCRDATGGGEEPFCARSFEFRKSEKRKAKSEKTKKRKDEKAKSEKSKSWKRGIENKICFYMREDRNKNVIKSYQKKVGHHAWPCVIINTLTNC